MASRKKLEMTALFGLGLQLVFVVLCALLAAFSGSRAVAAESWHLGAGLLVWFIVLMHGRQRRLAQEEREERERLKETRLSEEIFEETELDRARATTGLVIFEKYLVPILSVVFSGLLFYFVYRIWTNIWEQSWQLNSKAVAGVAMGMVFIAFAGYLIGKYAAGLARNRGFRLLRAAGGYVLGNVIAAILLAVAMGMHYFEIAWGEVAVAYVIPAIMGLVGVEVLLNLVLDIYRPRVEGRESRPPYDSRLLGLFAEPEGVLKTVAATLDYQFGFKVSETWFYRFMERAIVPLLLVQVVSLWLLTTMVVVDQDEVVFIERFGKPYVNAADKAAGLQATVFGPGFYLKAPWPLSVARHVPAFQVHSVELGKIREPTRVLAQAAPLMKDPNTILWRELHIPPNEGREISFLVPSTADIGAEEGRQQGTPSSEDAEPEAAGAAEPGLVTEEESETEKKAPKVNLARLEARVYYRVKKKPDGTLDERAAFAYQYGHTDVPGHLQRLAYRSLCRIAAKQDFLKWVAQERSQTARELRRRVARAAERAGLGVEVVDATIGAIHPPAQVATAYEGVVAALERKQSMIEEGEQAGIKRVAEARARRSEILNKSNAYAYTQTTLATAEAEQFLKQYEAYRRAPSVYMFRTYFDTIERSLDHQRVFVVPTAPEEVQIIDLEEKVRSQLLQDLDVLEEE